MQPKLKLQLHSTGIRASQPSQTASGPGTYALVGCVAAASLGLELMQTRILSFLYYNHVVYLTVTIALLGFGISGVFVSLLGARAAHPERMISLLAAGFAVSAFGCLGVVSRIPGWFPEAPTTAKLIASYVVLTIPFLFSGGVLGWTFMIRAQAIGRLYALDLACSSGAVMAFLLLLWPIGASWFIWSCSVTALVGFLAFSRKVLPNGRWGVAAIVAICALFWNKHLIGDKPESYKTLAHAYQPKVTTAKVEATEWTPLNRIDLWSDSVRDLVLTTPSPDPADLKMITQDADAFTMLWGPHHVAWALDQGRRGNLITALSLTYLLNTTPKDSLVIGVGGGLDIVMAKAHGAKNVTGVEINSATVSLDKGPYRKFLQWPNWEGVTLVRAEGRNYLRSRQDSYDTIVMSGVDTFSALNSGAYVLSENYLYTVQAMEDYLRALKRNGIAAIYRWFFFQGPRESLRLASIFQAASERLGIAHPERRIMVVSEDLGWGGGDFRWAATLIKKRAFTPDEVQKVATAISTNPRMSMVYMPKVFYPDVQVERERKESDRDPATRFAREVYNRLLTSAPAERDAFIRSYQFRIDPVYDDRPFFFEYFKPGSHLINPTTFAVDLRTIRGPAGYYVLYLLLAICSIMCVTCILAPLWLFQRRGLQVEGVAPLLLFFACLGGGYMLFEVGSMQVLNVYIGDPAYSLALVLAGLLVASGIGAALSTRFTGSLRVIVIVTTAIAAAIVIWLAWTGVLQTRTMQLPLVFRAVVTLVGLLPVGILLGMPFPTAVKALEKTNRNFIAWAWGVNGVTSVLASIIAIVVAMRLGFRIVVCLAAATYLLAMLSYFWHSRHSYRHSYL